MREIIKLGVFLALLVGKFLGLIPLESHFFWLLISFIAIFLSGSAIEETSEVLFPTSKFFVWAMGTSAAEIVVTVISGFSGFAFIGFATVLGSASVNLAFGMGCLLFTLCMVSGLRPVIPEKGKTALYSAMCWLLLGMLLAIPMVCYNHWELYSAGAISAMFSIFYFWKWVMQQPAPKTEDESGVEPQGAAHDTEKSYDGIIFGLGFLVLIAASELLVHELKEIALAIGVSSFLVAQIAGAIGTSVPEFVVGLTALRRAWKKMKQSPTSENKAKLFAVVIGVVVMAAASNAVDMLAADAVMAISLLLEGTGVILTPTVSTSVGAACLITLCTLGSLWARRRKLKITFAICAVLIFILSTCIIIVGEMI